MGTTLHTASVRHAGGDENGLYRVGQLRGRVLWASVSFLSVELCEECVAAQDYFAFELQHVAKDFRRGVVVHGGGSNGFVSARREAPIVLANLLEGHAVAVRALLAARPFGQRIGNVVGFDRCALVVQAEAVGGLIVEPNGPRGLSFLKYERGSSDACIGFEHAAGKTNDCLQVALGQEQLTESLRCISSSEQHAIRDNDTSAAIRLKVIDKPFQKE